jgi:hypothetical protein
MAQNSPVAVLRDKSTGKCFLVETADYDQIDLDRLEESWLELAGWLEHPEQHNSGHQFADGEEEAEESGAAVWQGLYFTGCEHDGCDKMIAIIDDGAPEYCTVHAKEAA